MGVVGRAARHLGVGQQYVEFEQGVMHQAVAKRRRLDSNTGRRTCNRDRLELRHDRRHDAVRQACIDERLVRREAFDVENFEAVSLHRHQHIGSSRRATASASG